MQVPIGLMSTLTARSIDRLIPFVVKAYEAEWDSDSGSDVVLAELKNLENELLSILQHVEAKLL